MFDAFDREKIFSYIHFNYGHDLYQQTVKEELTDL